MTTLFTAPGLCGLAVELRTASGSLAELVDQAASTAEFEGLHDLVRDLARVRESVAGLSAEADSLSINGYDPDQLPAHLRHELATPLNHAIGYCELWLDESLPPAIETDLRALRDSGRRLLSLVDEVLSTRTSVVSIDVQPPRTLETGVILVVDDGAENRDILMRRLTREGHEVVVAVDGFDALAKVGGRAFDLILLDCLMPRLDGETTLRRLKADPISRDIPVVMISASDEVACVARCIEAGAVDYLTKPFEPVMLRARIGASLEKKRLRDREVGHLQLIETERRRADELLRVMLPDEIIPELVATNDVHPRRFNDVAVMFCDIVGFTSYSEKHPPETIVSALRSVIHEFELIAAKHQVQKIKTIGDAFMAAAGLLQPVPNPVASCAACGLEMIEAARRLPPFWEIRVGINIGSVVAGLVGKKRYVFDLYGDTVNFASRLESGGIPGKITLSTDAWHRVAAFAQGASLGPKEIKGKGACEVFRLDGMNGANGTVCGPRP